MTQGRGMAGKSTCLWKSTYVANAIICSFIFVHSYNILCKDCKSPSHSHTFPGGDKSRKQLAEICTGVCILLNLRKRFQLGAGAAVSEVDLSHGGGLSLKDNCSAKRENNYIHKIGLRAENLVWFAGTLLYLQRELRSSAGPLLGCGGRTGVQSSWNTGLPAQHTHTVRQSSKTQRHEFFMRGRLASAEIFPN